jgi:tRNA-dihydrouridine synthase
MIYFAPLQGFTDFVYRKSYAQIFPGIDAFFIPYISLKNDMILPKYKREILPENNPQQRAVPQVLIKDSKELLATVQVLEDFGYNEVNLNLGCPYPMVTRRGKGSGLLPNPDKLHNILDDYFKNDNLELSIKLRAGLNSEAEIEPVITVLNNFPLKEIILHPRIAKQLYSGEIIDDAYQFALETLKHRLVFNGDISCVSDFEKRAQQFPLTKAWMLGRGILMNPFLPLEIGGINFSVADRKNKLMDFHRLVFESYRRIMDNEGNALNKMKQFWFYFSANFKQPKKAFKRVKKSNSILIYEAEIARLFAEYF